MRSGTEAGPLLTGRFVFVQETICLRYLFPLRNFIAAGAFISLCIEILQLPFASRASDVDDLIMNTLGAAVGYGIYAVFKRLKR